MNSLYRHANRDVSTEIPTLPAAQFSCEYKIWQCCEIEAYTQYILRINSLYRNVILNVSTEIPSLPAAQFSCE